MKQEDNRQEGEEEQFGPVEYEISRATYIVLEDLQAYLSQDKKDSKALKQLDNKADPQELGYVLKRCHFCGDSFGEKDIRMSCLYCFTEVHLGCSLSLRACFCKTMKIPYGKAEALEAEYKAFEFPIDPRLNRTKYQGIESRTPQSSPESMR